MIIVFGSLNMDIAIQVEKFPEPGETIVRPLEAQGRKIACRQRPSVIDTRRGRNPVQQC